MSNVTAIPQAASAFGLEHVSLGSPQYLLLILPLILFLIWYVRRGGLTRGKFAYLAVRAVIIALVCVALASPVYLQSKKTIENVPPVTVIIDSSQSMRMYPESRALGLAVYERLRATVANLSGEQDKVKVEFFSEGNHTGIGDALYQNMIEYAGEPTTDIVLTDGRNNYGRNPRDMAQVLQEANSTLFVLKPVRKLDDVYIYSVLGENKIPSNIKYDMLVRVASSSTNEVSYNLKVYVDGAQKFTQRFKQTVPIMDIPLSLSIKDIGIHEVKVEVDGGPNNYGENNVYYKSVKVVAKPSILLVSANASSPMLRILGELYNVDKTTRIDNDYSKYAAVVFDNVNSADLPRERVNKIKKYVLEGNGVAFIGGTNSFEYGGYNSSFIENILPVTSTEKPVERRQSMAVVFLIDISESTEYGSGTDSKIDVEKAVAINLMQAFNDNDSVGVIAFNTMPYAISPISTLGPKYDNVQNDILRLKFGGGTDMLLSLEGASQMLSGYTTNRYVIIISDGVIRSTRAQMTADAVAQMRDKGIKVYTVGVGFDTDEALMQNLASTGGGQYFSLKSDPQNRLKLVFGNTEDDKSKEFTPVIRRDQYHYITRGLSDLDATPSSVKGFNKVEEKNVAQLLLSTKGGQPILTVWRFGLGRVAALTTDNGLEWSPALMQVDSGKVMSAMTNWLIGDLEKGNKVRLNAIDGNVGDRVDFTAQAASAPTVVAKNAETMETPKVTVTRSGLNAYSGYFLPRDSGFYSMRAQGGNDQDMEGVAVNFPKEYMELGADDETLRRMAADGGGKLYDESNVDVLIDEVISRAKLSSTKEIQQSTDLWEYFAGAALLLYFLDAAGRRVNAILKRGHEE